MSDKIRVKIETLQSKDYEWIEKTLEKHACEDSITTAFDLDGYITAIVLSRIDLEPRLWIPFIFEDEKGPTWESEEEEEKFTQLVLHWFYEVYAARNGEVEYNPMLPEIERNGAPFIYVAPWSSGFLKGSLLWEDFDELPEKAQPHYHELALPAMIATSEGYEEVFGVRIDQDKRDNWDEFFMEQIKGTEGDIIVHLESLSEVLFPQKKTPIVNTEVKVGRNDPCTCGSGKKFKKCCG